MVKVFTKAIARREQIESRKDLGEGIELLLRAADLQRADFLDCLKYSSDNFPVVNLEVGDRVGGIKPVDLLDGESRRYIEKVLAHGQRLPNLGRIIVHLAAGCQVDEPEYNKILPLSKDQRGYILRIALDYIHSLDSENRIIALENTFPTDWMDEEKGIISYYPIGKSSEDFGERIRVFDIGHAGITAHTLKNLSTLIGNQGFFWHEKFGFIPVYVSEREEERRQMSPEAFVVNEIYDANIVEYHVSANKGLLDGFGLDEKSSMRLEYLLRIAAAQNPDAVFVAEVRDDDYVKIPNQRKMIGFLKSL